MRRQLLFFERPGMILALINIRRKRLQLNKQKIVSIFFLQLTRSLFSAAPNKSVNKSMTFLLCFWTHVVLLINLLNRIQMEWADTRKRRWAELTSAGESRAGALPGSTRASAWKRRASGVGAHASAPAPGVHFFPLGYGHTGGGTARFSMFGDLLVAVVRDSTASTVCWVSFFCLIVVTVYLVETQSHDNRYRMCSNLSRGSV